jgi:hypothetical protein
LFSLDLVKKYFQFIDVIDSGVLDVATGKLDQPFITDPTFFGEDSVLAVLLGEFS